MASQLSAEEAANSIPEWARTGHFRFVRWDGGPLETSKGILSGWPYFFVPNPQILYATTNWYGLDTIDLLERAHVNWIWVTWSNGFSDETERFQQDLLKKYIKECHRRGIHVSAYLSSANIFWEEMFEHVPQSKSWIAVKDGHPVPYGTADYQKLGRVTRYMADLSKPGWQDFTVARAMNAVEAGADGLMFDNNFGDVEQLKKLKVRVMAAAQKRNPKILVNSNYHAGLYLIARLENAITTEDGREPGIFLSSVPARETNPDGSKEKRSDDRQDLGNSDSQDMWSTRNELYALDVKQGKFVLNVGLLRTLWTVSEGWRPITIEDGARHTGSRFTNMYSVRHLMLALGEAHAFGASLETYQESKMLGDLYFSEKVAVEHWDALSSYNAFFERHTSFYERPESSAQIAVVVSANDSDMKFLNYLAAQNMVYDVVYEGEASASTLSRYKLVVAAPSVYEIAAGWKRLEDFRPEQLAEAEPLRVSGPEGVVANLYHQSTGKRTLVHLLNYSDDPASEVSLAIKGKFSRAELSSPDRRRSQIPLDVVFAGGYSKIKISNLSTYDVIVLQ
jgi:hypothetical protein